MAVYRADIEMLNHAIDGVGDTFLKKRQLAEQERKNISDQLLHQKMLETETRRAQSEEDRSKTTDAHYKALEKQAGLHQAFQDMQANTSNLRQSMSNLAEMVKNGAIDRDAAHEYFAAGVDQLDPEMKAKMMATPEFKAAYNGDIDWEKIPKPAPSLTPVTVPKTGALTPGGHFVAPLKEDGVIEKQEYPEVPSSEGSPAVPPSSGFLGIGSKPGTNAVPPVAYQPKRTVTVKHPAGWTPGQAAPIQGLQTPIEGTAPAGKPLDAITAKAYLQKAGGDKVKARQMAIQDGYSLTPAQ